MLSLLEKTVVLSVKQIGFQEIVSLRLEGQSMGLASEMPAAGVECWAVVCRALSGWLS
jgi:hypothetical protein